MTQLASTLAQYMAERLKMSMQVSNMMLKISWHPMLLLGGHEGLCK